MCTPVSGKEYSIVERKRTMKITPKSVAKKVEEALWDKIKTRIPGKILFEINFSAGGISGVKHKTEDEIRFNQNEMRTAE